MNNKNQSLETSRLISGGGFADPNHEQPYFPATVDYHWNAYLASGELECLTKAIEHVHLNGSDAIMERLVELWNAYLMSADIEPCQSDRNHRNLRKQRNHSGNCKNSRRQAPNK